MMSGNHAGRLLVAGLPLVVLLTSQENKKPTIGRKVGPAQKHKKRSHLSSWLPLFASLGAFIGNYFAVN